MDKNMITPLINRFNNLIDSLIDDFKQFNSNGETIVFLAEKTKSFIEFSKFALSNVMFGLLKKVESDGYNFDEIIKELESIINKIFDDINNSLENILPEEDEEEHMHGHDHHHHHHHHHHNIDVESIQGDIDKIIDNLTVLKKLLSDITEIVLSSLKYQSEEINDTIFKKEYDAFKENIEKIKEDFGKKV